MQAVAGQIEADRGLTVAPADVNPQIRLPRIDAGPLAAACPEPIHNGVFDPLRAVVAMVNAGAVAADQRRCVDD